MGAAVDLKDVVVEVLDAEACLSRRSPSGCSADATKGR
jgi:hypothetical protein